LEQILKGKNEYIIQTQTEQQIKEVNSNIDKNNLNELVVRFDIVNKNKS